MKLMIASDIHGSAYYCKKMVAAYQREHADRLLLLGDILYHGPRNDLPEDYDPSCHLSFKSSEAGNSLRTRKLRHGSRSDGPGLSHHAEYCLLELNGQTIFATHGHHFNPQNPPMLKDGDILLNGHTHIPANQNMGTYTYMNPGSVSIPKEGSAHGYMIFDGAFTWKDLDGNVLDISSNASAAR